MSFFARGSSKASCLSPSSSAAHQAGLSLARHFLLLLSNYKLMDESQKKNTTGLCLLGWKLSSGISQELQKWRADSCCSTSQGARDRR